MCEQIGSAFISHSAKEPDHSVAKALFGALQDVGIDVWWDEEGLEGGDSFTVEILEAIIRHHYFLFIVSPRSIKSKWCQRELIKATVRAGYVHGEMKLEGRMPAVCGAVGSEKFLMEYNLELVERKGTTQGANVFFTFVTKFEENL